MRGPEHAPWRRGLRRELAGLIAIKFLALALLWWLFFSPPHRIAVDADAAGRRLGVPQAAVSAGQALAGSGAQDARRD